MLASSSRNALKRAQTTLSHVITESSASSLSTSSSVPVCLQRQRRHLSAQAAVASSIFHSDSRGGQNGGLRHGPYGFEPDPEFRGPMRADPVARYNLQLGDLVERGMLPNVLFVCKKMKEAGVKPDRFTYSYILQACAKEGLPLEARAVFEDMLAMGILPDRQSFHHLLYSMRDSDEHDMLDIITLMAEYGIQPNEATYEHLILRYTSMNRIEQALQMLSEMSSLHLSPTLKTAQAVITTASQLGFARLALDLAEAFEQTSVRRLDGDVWAELLISSSDALYKEGVLRTWQKVVHELNISPDEGCCIQVLHTVARHGLSALGLDVLRELKEINVVWHEHHFAPVIEALCHENRLKEAFAMLDMIRSNGIIPVAETAYPIFQAIQHDTDAVDEAWGMLESLHEENHKIDITAFNVIIQASVALGDLQRAVGTYKAHQDLEVTPNVDTFNLLLAGCIVAHHRELGDRLLTEMKEMHIKPDVRTYERLVVLCLTQPTYEDAFFYLEETKSQGFLPPITLYEAIIRKCVQVGDIRYKLALEEMAECGYTVSTRLQAFIDSGGAHDISDDYKKRSASRQSTAREYRR
ncbi:hypothetical protein A0H81_09090 [Grifola frondosa]|uniref:Uncharacterized protein n=1 Tax=Grifola frondosa TaxID=5627 RepID=A0A1C7M108_GRIFR|nr:hypothetical protein A0H81_09090 [Grifola frondosa]